MGSFSFGPLRSSFFRNVLENILTPRITREAAIGWAERCGAVTQILSSAEHLSNPHERRRGGLNDWTIARRSIDHGLFVRLVDQTARPGMTAGLHVVKIAAASILLSSHGGHRTRLVCNTLVSGIAFVLAPRHHYGGDGADQVSFLLHVVSASGRAARQRPAVTDASLWFLALQGTMAYAVSGWVKLAGVRWRRGDALSGVMRTRTYGSAWLHRLLMTHPRLGQLMSGAVLVLECAFPVIYFVGRGRLAVPFVAAASAMHWGIGAVMNLGRFIPAFHGYYGAILYTALPREGDQEQRSDLVVPWTLTLVGMGGAVLALAAALRRERVMEVRDGAATVTTPDGAQLVARRVDPARGDDGQWVVLLEHGLTSSPWYWEWVVRGLTDRGVPAVTYHRAGYGPSRRGSGADLKAVIDGAVSMASYVREAFPGRRLLLVGHSLGGYVAALAAERSPNLIDAVALVDPTHPRQLEVSAHQREASDMLRSNLAISRVTLTLGLGALLDDREWHARLPEEARDAVSAETKDARLWAAGAREWRAALRHFDTRPEDPRLMQPLAVISAGLSLQLDPAIGELHESMTSWSGNAVHRVVPGSSHDRIVSVEEDAGQVVETLIRLMSAVEASAA